MKNLRVFALWVVLIPLFTCSASDFFFRAIDVKDGLADNFVRDITRDSYGYIWISTIHGLSRYDGYRFCNYMPHEFGGLSNDISSVEESADTTLWMLCEGELYTYEREKDSWRKNGSSRLAQLGVDGTMQVFYVDDRGNLWVATEKGLFFYDYSQRKLWQIPNNTQSTITHIISKNGVTVIITSDFKIYKVAQDKRRLTPISQAPTQSYNRDSRVFLDSKMNLWLYNSHSLAGTQWLLSLNDQQWRQLPELKGMGNVFVNAVIEDGEGNLWVGTGNSGIYVFSSPDGHSLTQVTNQNAFVPSSSHISCFYLDDNNTMWIGSAKLGVAYCDLNRPNLSLVSTGTNEDVSSLLQDSQGNLWVGFDGSGIMKKSPTGTVTYYSASLQQLPSNIVTSLAIHPDGSVMAGTYGSGISKFEGVRFVPMLPNDSTLKYVKAIATDKHDNIWVATVDKGLVKIMPNGQTVNYTSRNTPLVANGTLCLAYDSQHDVIYIGTAMGVSVYDCAKNQFLQIEQMKKLEGEYVSSLMKDNGNTLWIGSRNGLWAYHVNGSTLDHFTTEQGMSHNTVRAIARCGNFVWASTDNGLTCISTHMTKDNHFVYNCYPYLDSDALYHIVFSNNAALSTEEGAVLLGCYTGYINILPNEIAMHHPMLRVQFTEFRINGKSVSKSLTDFTIKYNDQLGISISGMVPAQNRKIKYLYRFKGEEEWMKAPNNYLFFAALSPGTHVLQVKAELPGIMESEIAELPIKVEPPLWLSKIALLLYLVIFATILYLLFRFSQLRQKRKLAIKQMEINLKKYEMEEDKIRFFTNISHDLKTPLTLVVAPLEKIRNIHLPVAIRTEVDVAWRNARQLHELVLQMLDFRRIDEGKEKVNLKHADMVSFVRQTVQGFSYYHSGKQIKLQTKLPTSPIFIDFDENKMRRVITNLLSNAFKYNTDNGSVTVALDINSKGNQHEVTLSVADTGIGVKDKHHIFNRFMQETHGQEQEGSGLGLHIVKLYVDMMGGRVSVADNKPKGSVFTVVLPVSSSESVVEDVSGSETVSLPNEIIADNDAPEKQTILVVDDNTDARLFLQRSLEDEFNVLIAANGKEALALLSTTDHVSLVVSDVMMPVMDGVAFFRHIKNDINYSHIPVIFLTAKSSEENIVAGLEEGAADYITKPYSLAVLRLRIRRILEWTQNVHNNVATGIEIKPSDITVSSLDEELISHVIEDIEANIQNMDYSVVQLSSAVGMTRGHLYKKLMAITGKSPLEFIRIIKVKRGKSLLDQGKTNISEVADMVGYSAKQFTHYFKMMYGETPSEHLKKRK